VWFQFHDFLSYQYLAPSDTKIFCNASSFKRDYESVTILPFTSIDAHATHVFILNKFSVYIHIKFSMKNLFIRIFSFLQKINLVSYLVVFFFLFFCCVHLIYAEVENDLSSTVSSRGNCLTLTKFPLYKIK
jgi:hypothetical protein